MKVNLIVFVQVEVPEDTDISTLRVEITSDSLKCEDRNVHPVLVWHGTEDAFTEEGEDYDYPDFPDFDSDFNEN